MLDLELVKKYVEDNIGNFHKKRLESLDKLKLDKVLKRKNPYLFKAKNVGTSGEIVQGIVDAHISSNEETLFGDWLEELAIFINNQVYSGWKSGIEGIDLEFDHDGKRHIVAIKSGPHWGNSTQIKKLKDYFSKAKRVLRTGNAGISVECVNGCCYGKDGSPDKGDYLKLCGQRFWEYISGDAELYKKIIEPLGYKAKEKNDDFLKSYSQVINKFTKEFSNNYCDNQGNIEWDKIVELNSKK